MATPISEFWKCHAEGCPRERGGYSWWCPAHRIPYSTTHNVLTPCPCHGLYPSGMIHHTGYTQRPVAPRTRLTRTRTAVRLGEIINLLHDAQGPLPGSVIADTLDVPWNNIRDVIAKAIRTGRIHQVGGRYAASPMRQ